MTIPTRRTPRQSFSSYSERVETEHGVDEFGPNNMLYVEFTCYWSIIPGTKGCHTQRNGDPGWPDEPAEAELLEVHVLKAEGEYAEILRDTAKGIEFLDSLEPDLRKLVEDDKDGSYHQSAFEAVATP